MSLPEILGSCLARTAEPRRWSGSPWAISSSCTTSPSSPRPPPPRAGRHRRPRRPHLDLRRPRGRPARTPVRRGARRPVADLTGRRIPFLAMTRSCWFSTACRRPAAVGGDRRAVGALIALTLLRLLQAFSVGGETSTSVSYLFESLPRPPRPVRRGAPGGGRCRYGAGDRHGARVQTLLTPAQLLAWGWRLPFLLALPFGLAMFALRRRLVESRAFAHTRRRGARSRRGGPCGDRLPARWRAGAPRTSSPACCSAVRSA